MQYETKKRSILKAISWRTWATITTAIIVYVFTGEFALAITIGFLEIFAKMGLYFFHERLWQKIRFGKKEIPSFVLWFTGLPASGKKALAEAVFQQLQKEQLKVERLDSHDVRPLSLKPDSRRKRLVVMSGDLVIFVPCWKRMASLWSLRLFPPTEKAVILREIGQLILLRSI